MLGPHARARQASQTSPFSDGSWCSKAALATLSAELTALSAEPAGWWAGAPRALTASVCEDERCLVSLFAIPDGGRVPLRKFPTGTVILHRALTGAFELSRWQLPSESGPNQRPPVRVMSRQCGAEASEPLATFGGLAQDLHAARGGACAVLEVALLSPVVPTTGRAAIDWPRAVAPVGGADGTGDGGGGGEGGSAAAEGEELFEARSAEQLLSTVFRALDAPDVMGARGAGAPAAVGARGARESPIDALARAIGGLAPELAAIDRRLLAPRQQPEELLDALGVTVPKGLLLHGPPGCGKTLLAREIAAALGAATVQVVSGPEMMSRFVGESERWVRELFEPAERDAQAEADSTLAATAAGGARRAAAASRLHVIVLDELDAFSRERGSLVGDPGIRDSIVNTLLAKMDGVRSVRNLLVIGTTNRIELIDRALLRAGRFEVHVAVRPPDAAGRRDVLRIHLRRMGAEGLLAADALCDDALADLAARADGFTGADLAGVVRAAASRALERAARADGARPVVQRADLERACAEVGAQTLAMRERRALAAALCPTHAWSVERVGEWLHAAGVGARARGAFVDELIDGRALCELHRLDGGVQERVLAEQLRVETLGERLRLRHALRELMGAPAPLDDAQAEPGGGGDWP